MDFLKKHKALIEKVNHCAINATPFFLFVDFLAEDPQLFSIEELIEEQIWIDFPHFKNSPAIHKDRPIVLQKTMMDFENYQQKFKQVSAELHYGNSFLTNLTCETSLHINETLEDIYSTAKAKYKIKFKDKWVCFSPEKFIGIEDGVIHAYPMKGTIDAALPNAEQQILNDKKETAEHYTIVDLMRNDLSMVATNVSVKRFRYIDEIKTAGKVLLQVSSEIEGRLPENYLSLLGEILFTLLPAGSISGAPKQKTLDIILAVEGYDRLFYTGVAFYFDGKTLDSCVLIRFIEKKNEQLVYKSGGGLTIHSDVKKEYDELSDKVYIPTI